MLYHILSHELPNDDVVIVAGRDRAACIKAICAARGMVDEQDFFNKHPYPVPTEMWLGNMPSPLEPFLAERRHPGIIEPSQEEHLAEQPPC